MSLIEYPIIVKIPAMNMKLISILKILNKAIVINTSDNIAIMLEMAYVVVFLFVMYIIFCIVGIF